MAKPKLKRRYFYRVRKGETYLNLTGLNCSCWGSVLAASETISLSQAQTWAEDYGGKVEKIRLPGDQQ